MTMDETDIDEIIGMLSPERIGYITKHTNSKPLILKIHQETLSLNGALMSIVGMIEIALRNIVYQNLNQYFNTDKQLFQSPAPFEWQSGEADLIKTALETARRQKYFKMSFHQKSQLELQICGEILPKDMPYYDKFQKVCNHIAVVDGDIIAKLTFFFWKRMYTYKYKDPLWDTTLKRTFPIKNKRSEVAKHLETIYQTRNRLAHHEPIMAKQLYQTIAAIQFIITNLNQPVQNRTSPLFKLLSNDINGIIAKSDSLYALMSKPAPRATTVN